MSGAGELHTMRRMSRCLALLLSAAVAWLPLAPPEHVHEAEEHGHQHLLVHRHAGTHHFALAGEHHDGAFDDDDAPVLTLAAVFTIPASPGVLASAVTHSLVLPALPVGPRVDRTPEYVERQIHGPPRAPAGLRAPPSTARL